MPANPEEAINAVAAAVREGKLSAKRINESALRVLAAKARVGLQKKKLVDVEDISDVIGSSESEAHAQLAADRAVTLVKNDGGILPYDKSAGSVLLGTDRKSLWHAGSPLRRGDKESCTRCTLQLFDPLVSIEEMDQAFEKAGECDTHVVAAFVSVAAYRGNVALGGNYPEFLAKLKASANQLR